MDVDLRPVRKLRESAAARSALGPIMEAVCASPADLARLRVVCDWIQYKQNFREAVVSRPVADTAHTADTEVEIAFDLRRCADIDPENLTAHVKQALADRQPGLSLEPWVPGRDSCIWRFNQLYWQALTHWEVATGREYEQSLPGGESDARNTEAARELILELFRIWDELDARRALPDELYILELGVGNGNQARTWKLDCPAPRSSQMVGSSATGRRWRRALATSSRPTSNPASDSMPTSRTKWRS